MGVNVLTLNKYMIIKVINCISEQIKLYLFNWPRKAINDLMLCEIQSPTSFTELASYPTNGLGTRLSPSQLWAE